jgi:hypothetical protein
MHNFAAGVLGLSRSSNGFLNHFWIQVAVTAVGLYGCFKEKKQNGRCV